MGKSQKKSKRKSSKDAPFISPLTASTQQTSSSDDVEKTKQKEKDELHLIQEKNYTTDNDKKMIKKRITTAPTRADERREAKRLRQLEEDEEERQLTSCLFGDAQGMSESAWFDDDDDIGDQEYYDRKENKDIDDEDEDNNGDLSTINDSGEALFTIDRVGDMSNENGVGNEKEDGSDEEKNQLVTADYNEQENRGDDNSIEDDDINNVVKEDQSAWIDEDDQKLTISLVSNSNRVRKLRRSAEEDVISGRDYEERLRDRFKSTAGATARTDWADINDDPKDQSDDDDDYNIHGNFKEKEQFEDYDDADLSDDDSNAPTASKLLSSTAPLLSDRSLRLAPNILKIERVRDGNLSEPSEATVQSVQFHPGADDDSPLLMTAGMDKTLRFFQIDGESNPKVHGIHFPNLPIRCASFLGDTGNVVVSGRRKFFYIYDTIAGKIDKIPRIQGRNERSLEKFATSPDGSTIAFVGNDGYIILVDVQSKSRIALFKMNGSCRAVTFTPDGENIISSGSDGDVYMWDIRSSKCLNKFHNEDGSITSSLSASSRFLAVGSESGVVNLYNDKDWAQPRSSMMPTTPKPLKTIMNLSTSIDRAIFNHDGQILAMSTQREQNGLKLLHVPSKTVFSNWPTSKTPLGYVWSLDFSPQGRYLAIGNDKGKCLLYNMKHYNED